MASEWKGIEYGRKCKLDSARDPRIDRGDLGNQISHGHSPQAKAEEGWDGAPFFRKKDTEESLIDSLAYPAKGRTIDSQVDDQTWHDLALDAVFDQLNYTQSSLGAEALYHKMRLLEFQPQDQLHDLEAFLKSIRICGSRSRSFSTNWVRRITTWRVALSQILASIMQVCPSI